MGLLRDLLIGLMLLGILLLIGAAIVGVFLLTQKAIGLLLILFGVFMLVWFPDVMGWQEYQLPGMTMKGIWIGIIAVIIGIILLIL